MARIRDYWRAVEREKKAGKEARELMGKCFKVGDIVSFRRGQMVCAAQAQIEMVSAWGGQLKLKNLTTGKSYWIDTFYLMSRPGARKEWERLG